MSAYLNYGRWVVDCPADDCRAALRVDAGVMVVSMRMTCDCRDESVCDHQQIPCGATFDAEMPVGRSEIDRLTGLRPHRRNRNWMPGESLDALKAENLRHGVRV